MRIYFLWVGPLALAVSAGVWLLGVSDKDFLTPPSQAQLASIRAEVESRLVQQDPVPEPEPPPVLVSLPAEPLLEEEPKKALNLGDLTAAPKLAQYAEHTAEGPAYLIVLAKALEEKNLPQLALLAWERVLDLTRPDREQAATALAAIRRIQPTVPLWNLDGGKALLITLHAGTGKSMAKTIRPTLEAVAKELTTASSGILVFTTKITAGKNDLSVRGPAPVALWLSGPKKDASSTEVLSFTSEVKDSIRGDVLKTIFQLMRAHLNQHTSYTTPVALAEGEDPLAALRFRFTRLCWQEFGTSLNLPKPKEP